MEALGRLFDISIALAPVDLATAGMTGKRVSMKHCSGISIVLLYGAGTDGDDPVPSLQQHTASSGGTSADLTVLDHLYHKAEATLDGDETWTKATQTNAAILTAIADHAQVQKIYVIEVAAEQLDAGYEYISVNQADLSNNAQLAAAIYIMHGLAVQRAPANMAAPLS